MSETSDQRTLVTGFTNPVFGRQVDDDSQQDTTIDLDDTSRSRSQFRRQSSQSTFNPDLDYLFCGNVITIKARTRDKIRQSIRMAMPLFVLIGLIIILIGVFRIDILVSNDDQNDGE